MLEIEDGPRLVDRGWMVDCGIWTVDDERWTKDGARRTVDGKTPSILALIEHQQCHPLYGPRPSQLLPRPIPSPLSQPLPSRFMPAGPEAMSRPSLGSATSLGR